MGRACVAGSLVEVKNDGAAWRKGHKRPVDRAVSGRLDRRPRSPIVELNHRGAIVPSMPI
jgi:hypothetical protein